MVSNFRPDPDKFEKTKILKNMKTPDKRVVKTVNKAKYLSKTLKKNENLINVSLPSPTKSK